MSKRKAAAILFFGVLLGFFLTATAVELRHSPAPRSVVGAVTPGEVDAAAVTLTEHFGALQAAVHPAGHTKPFLVVFIRTLSDTKKSNAHCPCPTVFQMQRALKASGIRPKTSKSTGIFGTLTREEIQAFQRAKKIAPSGIYGPVTHKALSPYYDAAGRGRLQQIAHSRQVSAERKAIVHAESIAWTNRNLMGYSEGATRGFLPLLPNVPRGTDCSGYATWLYKVSGLADPSGFGYRVVGYTGTLALHGKRISANARLFPGDLVFYGGGYPFGHVAIVSDGFRRLVSSHGSAGIKVLPFNYRPVSVIRRYF
jgi:cell wall-associated NlpC family hydrolase